METEDELQIEIANIPGFQKPGTIFTMLRDTGGIKPMSKAGL